MQEIKNIIAAYEQADLGKEKIALATVVNVEESSYRRIGARMLVRSNGQWVGGISGGCLEGDALKRSLHAIYQNVPSKVIYDTIEEDENQIGVGLGCNGKIEVVFTPIDANDNENEILLLKQILDIVDPIVMLRVIESNKISLLGKIAIANPEIKNNFIGIDKNELAPIIDKVKSAGRSYIEKLTVDSKIEVRVLFELIRPETKLVILGDNYDVSAMVGLANQLAWNICILGDIKKLNKEVLVNVAKVIPYKDMDRIKIHDHTAVVLLSHDYVKDMNALQIFIKKKPRYLGMLGPKKRMLKMEESLGEFNFSKIPIFYSPVGLEIGAETPSEIALSILAEIIAVFRNKNGTHLRDKVGAIHQRDHV